ncbi:hypothetical protein [Desulfosporosinus hippei]|uniref:Uncharacterized protein n=1 Tax=Desulfosporosinus hippei DSM 8344 TaxID=1121419 RepID=A0A1G7UI91_9FIRM|nr:hypothetical protein [Desulfosporosinus hippei]SDG47224.1 hypothetical protein SAMN05443529_103152 [Desulfosporosinus hippei DSM 8344]
MKQKIEELNKMYWYHWVAIYVLIGSAVAFWIIPGESLWLKIVIAVVGMSSYLVIAKLPREDVKDL